MKEKDFQITFAHWCKAKFNQTAAFELKLARTDSLPFASVVPHQVEALFAAKRGTLFFKLPDVGYQNPFDCICLSGVSAFVVIKYPSGTAYGIDIDDFIRERDRSNRKSLTEDSAKNISSFSF